MYICEFCLTTTNCSLVIVYFPLYFLCVYCNVSTWYNGVYPMTMEKFGTFDPVSKMGFVEQVVLTVCNIPVVARFLYGIVI